MLRKKISSRKLPAREALVVNVSGFSLGWKEELGPREPLRGQRETSLFWQGALSSGKLQQETDLKHATPLSLR